MFSLGRGKIQINLTKYQFAPGDTIDGTVLMTLKKPTEAAGVKIRLVAQERVVTGGGSSRNSRTVTLFDFELPLDGPKTYLAGQPFSYNFSIKVPPTLKSEFPDNKLGAALKMASTFMGARGVINWFLKASLDIPKKIDFSKTVKINVA
ncbi:MAG: hypothetical protein ABIE94_05840 [archaeon]